MTDDRFEPEDKGAVPPGEPAGDACLAGAGEGRPAYGRLAVDAVWQEGTPGHWVIKLIGLPGAPVGQEVVLGRPDASNHSPSLSERAPAADGIGGISVAWIESPPGDASGVGRVMWQSFPAAPASSAPPEAAANDNARWVTDPNGAGVFGSEPTVAALVTGETLLTWIGTDGHAHGRLYAAADANVASSAGNGADAPEQAAVNAALGDLGPVGPASEGGRRLQAAELRPGAFAVMWLALDDSDPVLRGSLFLTQPRSEDGDDPGWTERPLPDVRPPPGATGLISLLPGGDNGAGLQVALAGTGGPVTVDVVDRIDAALVGEHLTELAPEGLPGLPAAAAPAAHAAPGAAVHSHLLPQVGQGEAPALHENHGAPAKTALAIATTPGVTETAPVVAPVQQGFAVAWQAPAGTDAGGVQIKLTLFSKAGVPTSPEILVADNAAANVAPAIARLRDGVAAAYVEDGNQTLVVKAYAGDGAQIGDEAVVDPGESNAISEIAIASTAEDQLAVVYVQQHAGSQSGQDGSHYGNIMLQRFAVADTDGQAQLLPLGRDGAHDGQDGPAQLGVDGGEASAPDPAVGRAPAVAGVEDGDLAIVWVESDGGRETIRGCILDEGGGQVLRIDLTGLLESAGIAAGTKPTLLDAGDGDFLVTWLQPDGDRGGYVVMSALYDEVGAGVWLTPEEAIRLKAFDSEPEDYSVVVSSDEDGSFIDVIWRQDGSETSGGDKVLSQRYDLDGHRLGYATKLAGDDALDDAPAGDTLAAAGLSDGQIVVVYAEQNSHGDLDLAAHIIDTAPAETASAIVETAQAADDAASTTFSTDVDQETAINPLANGIEAGLAIAEINGVPISTAAPVDVGSGWVQLREDGWLTVAPDAGYTGPIAFEYTVAGAADGAPTKGHAVVNVEPAEELADVTLHNQLAAVPEDISTTGDLKVADIAVADGQLGTDGLSLTGLDAGMFKIVGNALYLKSGIELDFETKPTLSIEIAATHSNGFDGATRFTLSVESAGDAVGDTFVFAPGYGDTGAGLEADGAAGTGYATFQELLASGALTEAGDDVVVALDPGAAADPSKIVQGVEPSAPSDTDFKYS